MGESGGLHVAVLTIADAHSDPAIAAYVADKLRAAGHTVAHSAQVENFVPVVRRQLGQWITEGAIDVVVVVGGTDDGVASSALGPLVTQALPGFADLLRAMLFVELGTAAMLATPDAARCSGKFVFVVPGTMAVARVAVDKLLVPQMDKKTEPTNIPRMMGKTGKPGADDAPKPTVPAASKTMPPPATMKLPAMPPGATPPPNRTTPPPFKKLTTPPMGVKPPVAVPALAPDDKVILDLDAVGGEELAASDPKLPKVEDKAPEPKKDDKLDDKTINRMVEIKPRGRSSAEIKLPGVTPVDQPVIARERPKSAPPPVVERVIEPDEKRGKKPVGMFTPPPKEEKVGPVAKILAGLALLSLVGAGAVVLISKLGIHENTVAANPGPPSPQPGVQEPAPQPQPEVVTPAEPNPTVAQVETPAPSPEIDIDPPTPSKPNPHFGELHPKPAVDTSPKPAVDTPPKPVVEEPKPAVDTTVRVAQPPTSTEEGCDEVSCVLNSYAAACCAAYKPKAENHAPGIPETLDKGAVRAGVDTMKPVVIGCGEKFASKGTVRVSMEVAPDGHVTSASVDDSPDAQLGACVATALRKAHFAKSQNGASFVYPFVF